MRFSEVAYLRKTVWRQDEIKNQLGEAELRKVYVNRWSDRYRAELGADVKDLKPTLKLELHSFEYKGEKGITYQQRKYNIIHVDIRGDRTIINCESVIMYERN